MFMKVVLITGATSGVGFETAKLFSSEKNTKVISLSVDLNKINLAKKALPKVEFLQCDVTDYCALLKITEIIDKKYGKIDVLVNNAGTIIQGNIETLAVEDWDKVIKSNFSSYYYVTKALLPLLKKGENANIVNISSISATVGGSSIAYSCSKAGVNMISQSLAKDLAKYKIRVNTISPGMFNSGFHVHNNIMTEKQYDDMLKKQSTNYPFGIGTSLDIANAILFISSEKAKWITGANLLVDGGNLANK